MTPTRHRVMVHPHQQPLPPFTAPGYAVAYFPDGCPPHAPHWPAADGRYPGPHVTTVCPDCLPEARLSADLSAPVTVPADMPMIYALEPIDTPPDLPAVLDLLHEAGFTRIARLPLRGAWPERQVLTADHPTHHSRVILHSQGLRYDLHYPGRDPYRGSFGPDLHLTALATLLLTAGYSLPSGSPEEIPLAGSGAVLLTADETADLIVSGDYPDGGSADIAAGLDLLDAVRAGTILAFRLPDGSLATALNPLLAPPTEIS
ncbi:hypothetical protein MXD61_05210 [Frankia sp. AgPm24]|uniref:hypothetical protein n=1 Tax=Frankia sp. AgPm24 TaxID=631128 RepID=UPI00200D85B1|nr:hypothetical protein [Frankia sp. AgPm24]MCK9921305.1 hypothetical protein [Frankia sp. AgPm24]